MQFLERWLIRLSLSIRSLWKRRQLEAELDEEILLHVEHLTERHIADGMAPTLARRTALTAMQGIEQRKEECRDARSVSWIEDTARDLRYAVRMLRLSPVFAVVAVLSMSLGIGANSAVFSLIDTLLLRPLPVSHPQELRHVFLRLPEFPQPFLSYPMFQALSGRTQAFTSFAAWSDRRLQTLSNGQVVHVEGQLASGTFFTTLNVSAAYGRVFIPADDHPTGGKNGPVAVISDPFWSRRFQRSSSALGSGLVLNGIRFTVIGIMPSNFFGAETGAHPDVWIPVSFADRVGMPGCLLNPACAWLTVLGRTGPGVSAEQANAELQSSSRGILEATTPRAWNPGWQKRYHSYRLESDSAAQGWSFLRLQFTRPLTILMSLVALVLLVACANMANLLMARASSRHHEIAVRLSIGASRARVIRQLLTESLLLSTAGGFTGILFAIWLTRTLAGFLSHQLHGPPQFTRLDLHPDTRIVLFTIAVTLASGLLFGWLPSLRITRSGVASSLKESVYRLHATESRFRSGSLVLTAQVALSVLLVTLAGLFGSSLWRLLTVSYGFHPDNVWLISLDTEQQPRQGNALAALYTQLLEGINRLPGVKAASVLQFIPLTFDGRDEALRLPGKPDLPNGGNDVAINLIGPRFFEAMGSRLLSGRPFTTADRSGSEPVGILNQLAGQRFFPNEEPLAKSVLLGGTSIRIVGVAENMKQTSLRQPDEPALYLPYTQQLTGRDALTCIIRTVPGASSPDPAVRGLLRTLAPDVPISLSYTMQEQIADSVGLERLMASLSTFFGTLALLLSSIGLYGILAYTVTRRTGEIGMRIALGARPVQVVWLILRQVSGHVASGILIGILGVSAASKLIASFLYGVRPNDPSHLAIAVLVLLSVAGAAALLPSLRASRIDPAVSLRQE